MQHYTTEVENICRTFAQSSMTIEQTSPPEEEDSKKTAVDELIECDIVHLFLRSFQPFYSIDATLPPRVDERDNVDDAPLTLPSYKLYRSLEEVEALIGALNERGVRESALKKALNRNMAFLTEVLQNSFGDRSVYKAIRRNKKRTFIVMSN